jgi:hypothetical protein
VLPAYAVPAALLWAALGAVLGALPLARPALLATAAYAALFGTAEAAGWLGLAAPGTRWQVPQQMVAGAGPKRRILVWGAILGPGFATRNPYAGFGLLVLAVAGAGGPRAAAVTGAAVTGAVTGAAVTGAAVGLAHAVGRALALLRDARRPPPDPMRIALVSACWRAADGYALLLAAAAIGAACAHLPG